MTRLNTAIKYDDVRTHGGAQAFPHLKPIQELRRSVLSCLLWEDEFYEDGEEIAQRIVKFASAVPPQTLADLAIEARTKFNLRHAPLLLLSVLAETGSGNGFVSKAITETIQRADELSEFLVIYAKVNGVTPDKLKGKLSAQVKKGLAKAFVKFDAYQLAKYDRAGIVRLRDVLFLSHAKPHDADQTALWKKLIANELVSPDTWEVGLSAGADKKETFERLIRGGKLGYLALLRNLRNMEQAGCDTSLIRKAITDRRGGASRVLPFRYISAARACPTFEPDLDTAMIAALAQGPKLLGRTLIVVDISGSMDTSLSERSLLMRMDAASALAAILRGSCEDVVVYATAGNDGNRKHATAMVPPRQGMALRDAIVGMRSTLGAGGIFLKPCLDFIQEREKQADRIVVITDEQDCTIDRRHSPLLATPFGKYNYLLNVAGAKNGIGYGKWIHIDGFSEAVVRFILESETTLQQ